jgi:hypothetical protein
MENERLLEFFEYGKEQSTPEVNITDLAQLIITVYDQTPERTVALRKLIEVRDELRRCTFK